MFGIYVRAKTSDNRWASVDVADLDERSFRRFVADKLAEAGLCIGVRGPEDGVPFSTPLTRAEAEET